MIALEGIDASGKETQAELLREALIAKGYQVKVVSFPRYTTPVGRLIKEWLTGELDISIEAFHMLMEVDKQDFMRYVRAWEEDGVDFLVLDRFTLSNIAFGMAKGIDLDWLASLQRYIRKPDVTFLLDITTETSRKRKGQNGDRHETDNTLLDKVRTIYLALAERDDPYIVVIDADQAEPSTIHESIMSHLENLILL